MMQASRDGELSKLAEHIRQLQQLLRDKDMAEAERREKEGTVSLRIQDLERQVSRDAQLQENMEYLKNIICKYMEVGGAEHEKMFPVIATLLQFSPDEVQRIKKKREAAGGFFGAWL